MFELLGGEVLTKDIRLRNWLKRRLFRLRNWHRRRLSCCRGLPTGWSLWNENPRRDFSELRASRKLFRPCKQRALLNRKLLLQSRKLLRSLVKLQNCRGQNDSNQQSGGTCPNHAITARPGTKQSREPLPQARWQIEDRRPCLRGGGRPRRCKCLLFG